MTNQLAGENSPYLLQHANNPVDWYPWGAEALERARSEDKAIFLSIGYAACHWCHVMEHESFEDPETARLMNEHFINIKVDREERPDLDSIYMNAVVAITGQGGWPMSVFLTPDGQPFYGGTYFPPVRRYNMPAFKEVLLTIARLWAEEREKLLQSSQELSDHLKSKAQFPAGQSELGKGKLSQASQALMKAYDWQNGGWGGAPKFPQPMAIEFLLRQASRGDDRALEMALHALGAMRRGGMYDVVGGGFARYSTDDTWLVPHFEKMLYDNAQLAQAYLYAYLLSGQGELRQVCEETLDFVLRELSHPVGGFFSSLDADSEGAEGRYYVWTEAEIRDALGDPEDAELFKAAYATSPAGNFEGSNVLQRAVGDAELAERFGMAGEQVQERLRQMHKTLLAVREKRVRPNTDDKVLVSWNGLMLCALAEAGRYLQRADYLQAAKRNAEFLLAELHPGERLLRSWREGQARHNAYLEDYAALILGLLALYQSDPEPRWFRWAERLTGEMVENFRDAEWGFFDTRADHEALITRPKDMQDNATPCGNSLACNALLQMAAFTGKGEWRDIAEGALRAVVSPAVRYPTAFAKWLSALDFGLGPVMEVAVLGEAEERRTQELVKVLWSKYRPRVVAARSGYPPAPEGPALLDERRLVADMPTAYVCQGFICRQPVTEPAQLQSQLELGEHAPGEESAGT